jgi:hypothetical protein
VSNQFEALYIIASADRARLATVLAATALEREDALAAEREIRKIAHGRGCERDAARTALLNAKRYLAAKKTLTPSERRSLAALDEAVVEAGAAEVSDLRETLREALDSLEYVDRYLPRTVSGWGVRAERCSRIRKVLGLPEP